MDVKSDLDPIQLDSFLPYQVSLLADRISRRTAASAKKRDGLNLSHWRVLAAIAEAPGRSANDVVSVTPMDKGIVSRAVKGLIDMRLIVRTASDDDGRLGHLHLTAKGEQIYMEIAEEVREAEKQLAAHLPAQDYAHLMISLKTLIKAMG